MTSKRGRKPPILSKRYELKVEYIDHMGSDLRVVNAARVSFANISNKFTARDAGLIEYLARHGHWTPFAHPQVTLLVEAPIFVARQLYKHTIGLVVTDDDDARTIRSGLDKLSLQLEEAQAPVANEVSRRYVAGLPGFYMPEEWRLKAENKKQGSSDETITEIVYEGGTIDISKDHHWVTDKALDFYKTLLDAGVAPEMARMVLPQTMYTQWYWTGSLAAFARVYQLRSEATAQQEAAMIVSQIKDIVTPLFPVSWRALTDAR